MGNKKFKFLTALRHLCPFSAFQGMGMTFSLLLVEIPGKNTRNQKLKTILNPKFRSRLAQILTQTLQVQLHKIFYKFRKKQLIIHNIRKILAIHTGEFGMFCKT